MHRRGPRVLGRMNGCCLSMREKAVSTMHRTPNPTASPLLACLRAASAGVTWCPSCRMKQWPLSRVSERPPTPSSSTWSFGRPSARRGRPWDSEPRKWGEHCGPAPSPARQVRDDPRGFVGSELLRAVACAVSRGAHVLGEMGPDLSGWGSRVLAGIGKESAATSSSEGGGGGKKRATGAAEAGAKPKRSKKGEDS